MKILDFGSINIDHVYSVPHTIRAGETLSSTDVNDFAGGKGANQSVALAKAGAEVWFSGKVGTDGLWLLEKLNGYGVNTELVNIYDGPTGHTIIQLTPEGENCIILYGGGNQSLTEEEIEKTFTHFEEGDYLVLQNEINHMPLILETAFKKKMKICLNPAPFETAINEWPLEYVDVLIVNELEAEGLAAVSGSFKDILMALTGKFKDTEILMTVGESGSFYGKNDNIIHVPITKTIAVDTTAAGDTFLGYFLASRIKGQGVLESMKRASKASSITVSRPGAMDSIPLLDEIEKYT